MNTDYEYFNNGWLKAETHDGKRTDYEYYPTSEKKLVKYPNNTETFYEYNCYSNPGDTVPLRNHYLKKLTNRKKDAGPVISYFEYTYDLAGQRLTMKELRGTNTYTYDHLYRLTEVTYPDARNVKYTYDKAGNRLTMQEKEWSILRSVFDTKDTSYEYDLANQLKTSTCTSVSTSTITVTTTNTWDLNGNMTAKIVNGEATSYTWDALDRLRVISYPTSKGLPASVMEYNGNGMRTRQTNSEGTTNYVFEGLSSVLELDNAGNITKKYHGGISFEKIKTGDATQEMYFLYDGIGSVVNLVDERGVLVQVYYYNVFGQSTNVKHDPTNKKQFTGKEVDEDSGLQYFLARYYDPEVGRFLSKDPNPGLNVYVYCDNNPINKVDPDGRESQFYSTPSPTKSLNALPSPNDVRTTTTPGETTVYKETNLSLKSIAKDMADLSTASAFVAVGAALGSTKSPTLIPVAGASSAISQVSSGVSAGLYTVDALINNDTDSKKQATIQGIGTVAGMAMGPIFKVTTNPAALRYISTTTGRFIKSTAGAKVVGGTTVAGELIQKGTEAGLNKKNSIVPEETK